CDPCRRARSADKVSQRDCYGRKARTAKAFRDGTAFAAMAPIERPAASRSAHQNNAQQLSWFATASAHALGLAPLRLVPLRFLLGLPAIWVAFRLAWLWLALVLRSRRGWCGLL